MSGIWTLASGIAYTVGYGYQSQGNNVNITGSPDFGGMVTLNNVGSGCSGNVYAEFNAAGVTPPTYGSTGLESGRLQLRGCATDNVDTSIVRRFRFWKFQESRRFEFRADIYNTLNAVQISGNNAGMVNSGTFNNPAGGALQNGEFNSTGGINPGKQLPKNAGFGAANNAATMRNIQLEVRFGF